MNFLENKSFRTAEFYYQALELEALNYTNVQEL